jgi:16S rRNA (cytidine1402-2'-O)-methyltransferase
VATLYIVATPIGNLEDLTYRAVRLLGEVDVLACEDTRQTRKLFERYSIPRPKTILSYHEHNEQAAGKRILGYLKDGKTVALCADAGLPGISDPGYRIICDVWKAGIEVRIIPGATAVSTAILASGLPSSSYTFKGFPPRRSGQRRRFLLEERDSPHTLVLFESPYRVAALLRDAYETLGNRLAAVCIELTKKFENTKRGYLRDLAMEFEGEKVRGEVTVVIAGNNSKFIKEEPE